MKNWLKTWQGRTVIGLAAVGILIGGAAAYTHHRHEGRMGESDIAELRAKFIARAADKLDLDAAQKARLGVLADAVNDQRVALMASTASTAGNANPRSELQALVAGPTFDRARAQALVESKTAALRDKAPTVVTTLADFYDGLRPEQQQKLRELMSRGRGQRWGHG